ncbi:hypothetical protein HMPREF9946_04451 [Acetobacteraceae bacterium AT-5844]|nr:hypothetical protein HMPREF9946_04451 [Acetobacteraceae bacterium AT-5844]
MPRRSGSIASSSSRRVPWRSVPPLDGHRSAQHDSRSFAGLRDPENTASRVWADTAYCTKRNLEVLERRGLSERIPFRRAP